MLTERGRAEPVGPKTEASFVLDALRIRTDCPETTMFEKPWSLRVEAPHHQVASA
ncbi:MAG: hypothetical protein OXU19_00760 [bacterium]|nr:hypothetical protein [bacterium]